MADPAPRRKNQRRSAVAIRYERETMPAPRVVAKGKGIKRLALPRAVTSARVVAPERQINISAWE